MTAQYIQVYVWTPRTASERHDIEAILLFLEGELFFFLQFLFFESFMHVCNGILITATSPQMLFSCANMLAVLVSRSLSAVIPGCRALAYNPQNKGDYFQMLLVNPFSPGLKKKKTEAVWKTHIF